MQFRSLVIWLYPMLHKKDSFTKNAIHMHAKLSKQCSFFLLASLMIVHIYSMKYCYLPPLKIFVLALAHLS
jgi:hypothetical protein